jgi:hypothetical protein
MIKNKKWESLAWVIMWVFMFTVVITWIVNLISNSNNTINTFKNKQIIQVLKNNTDNINQLIYNEDLDYNDVFYIKTDKIFKTYEYLTWSMNENYKYIDKYWNNIMDINNYNGDLYIRELKLETNINNKINIINTYITKLN